MSTRILLPRVMNPNTFKSRLLSAVRENYWFLRNCKYKFPSWRIVRGKDYPYEILCWLRECATTTPID